MDYSVRPLEEKDYKQASDLDKKWFGANGISETDLKTNLVNNLQKSLGIFKNERLIGFVIFETLADVTPKDYIGINSAQNKTLFIQQFTTESNYRINNWENDSVLLKELEKIAQNLGCSEIWEALAKNHPYKKENNSEFDAFGFYLTNGFKIEDLPSLSWQPNTSLSIPCFLFRKNLANNYGS